MKELPNYMNTAGKITVITALLGVVVFAVVFLLNIGAQELKHVEAQGLATTSVTVLNTPPQWTVDAQELLESSATTPTNSGSQVQWTARATDSNSESYYLLICSNGNAPTANAAAAPTCGSGATEWAVSALTTSGATSTASVTATEVAPFLEQNDWYAWVCDSVLTNPRCNASSRQGAGATASPFNVNKRPTFTVFGDNSPTLPGATVTFTSTASDADIVPSNDTVRLFVCSSNSFDTGTNSCTATTLASSTLSASDPSVNYVIPIPTRDQNYAAYGFVIDNHGHQATGGSQGTDSVLTVANAAPSVSAAQIVLNNGLDLVLTMESGQTTGFPLQFTATDNNSCENAGGTDEITDYKLSVFRSGVGSSTCNGDAGSYNANNCYPSDVATTTWNLECAVDVASCSGPSDTSVIYNCTFPLWYIADSTDDNPSVSSYPSEDWRAAVSAIDDDSATSSFTQSSTAGIDLGSFLSVALDTFAIPYGLLEPGQQTDPLTATTQFRATGNVGVDQLLTGESMCVGYTTAVTCNTSATSTIAESNQVFATSTVAYSAAESAGHILSSTTNQLLDLNVPKSTSTSVQASRATYWGIRVPISITLAGSYTGENTFFGAVSAPNQW